MPDRPLLSVVIPTLDEQTTVGALLSDLAALIVRAEVIVADGGSTDLTLDVCRAAEATIVQSATGRGVQLRAGADVARAPLLFFVHADARLDRAALALLDEIAVAPPPCAMAFRLWIDAPGLGFRLIEWGANLRSRLLRLPYGDQGLLVRREDYVRAGGSTRGPDCSKTSRSCAPSTGSPACTYWMPPSTCRHVGGAPRACCAARCRTGF